MADWDQLQKDYADMVWRTAFRILAHYEDALDCSQDVFVEAFASNRRSPIQNWGGFLKTLTTRRAIDSLRIRIAKQKACEKKARALRTSIEVKSQTELDVSEQLRMALGDLPGQQSQAFWLSAVEGMSHADISHELDCSENAVGMLIFRARSNLKQTLKANSKIL